MSIHESQSLGTDSEPDTRALREIKEYNDIVKYSKMIYFVTKL